MKIRTALLLTVLSIASFAWGQDSATRDSATQSEPSLYSHHAKGGTDSASSIMSDELPNMKADLAELRAMLNVLASQESGPDPRTAAALQTNRKMWQIVIARLAEMTQRLEASEQRTGQEPQTPRPKK